MDWRSYDRWEQEQLDICRALIEDATKDTALWLQGDASAEERVHVLEIQTGLANLTRIIERRMDRHNEAKDDWDYSETVSEVLLNLDKARELRGNIVGKGLARLALLLASFPASSQDSHTKNGHNSFLGGGRRRCLRVLRPTSQAICGHKRT
jgi:hypothetical protein